MKYVILFCTTIVLFSLTSYGQTDTTAIKTEAQYSRPFITVGATNTAVGGYVEGNTNYFSTDGVTEGLSLELRRFNIFLYSVISPRIRFLSELEFEHGVEEISLETAMLDFEINPALVFRGGIILAPIGNVNQDHDSPKWEFVERPLVATEIIPSTLSEVGFGIHGNLIAGSNVVTYDAYLVNGLQDGVILNESGKTVLKHGKSPEMFEEDNNGVPMMTGKISVSNRKTGTLGISYYGGTYNTYVLEGSEVDDKRNLSIMALDFSTVIKKKLTIKGEFAQNKIDVPSNLSNIYGNDQFGYYLEFNYPIWRHAFPLHPNSVLNFNLRTEMVDYNLGTFNNTSDQGKIYDEIKALVVGLSYRPTQNVVVRSNYRYHWEFDYLGNEARTAGFQFGFAAYF